MSREISPEAQDDTIWSRVLRCLEAAIDKKAFDPVVLDLRGHSQVADYFVLLSGRSDTQVRAIAEAVEESSRRDRVRPLSVEGARRGQWILLDFGDFVVHVFYKPVREFYDLERLWARAPRRALPDSLLAAAADERPALAPPR